MRAADAAWSALGGVTAMTATWICDFCGYEGSAPDRADSDQVQCPMCGEPVMPVSR